MKSPRDLQFSRYHLSLLVLSVLTVLTHLSYSLLISQCKFNGIVINCGDDVIINGDKDQCFVGHVEKLYEQEEAEDPNRAIIQWYFTHDELSILTKKITVHIPEPWRELFLPSEDVCNRDADVDAETISRKCTVLRLKPQDIVPDCLQRQEDLYYVRYKFDQYYKLHPVNKRLPRKSISDSERNVERRTSRVRTPNITPRRVSSIVKTPQAKKTPAKEKGKQGDVTHCFILIDNRTSL